MAQLQATGITGSLTTTGDLAVNGGDITSTAAILNINAGGTVAVQDNFVITGTLSSSGKIITAGDLSVNGGDLNSTATNFALLASPTTVTFANSASDLYLGLNATDIRIGDQIGKNGTTLIYNDLLAASGDSTFFRSGGGSSVVTISGSGVVGSGLIIESGPDDTSFINFSSSGGFKISGADEAGITIVSGGVLEAPQGIKFDVTGEVLDDYEEGTWSPVISGSTTAGSFTYDRSGFYTKIGNMVHIHAYINVSTVITTPTGNLSITGLPFASLSFRSTAVMFTDLRGTTGVTVAQGNIATSVIQIWKNSIATTELVASDLSPANGLSIVWSLNGSYRV